MKHLTLGKILLIRDIAKRSVDLVKSGYAIGCRVDPEELIELCDHAISWRQHWERGILDSQRENFEAVESAAPNSGETPHG